MSTSLKPCPFCGSDRIIVRKTTYDPNGCCENEAFVQCQNCGCSSRRVREHEQMGIVSTCACDSWNRRAERTCWRVGTDIDGISQCSECEALLGKFARYCPNCGARVVEHEA